MCDEQGRRVMLGTCIGNRVSTYLLIVSESPITQRCRFGRVIATASFISTCTLCLCVDIAASQEGRG
jgi:hypothetical protein